jgi:hypothetical protein
MSNEYLDKIDSVLSSLNKAGKGRKLCENCSNYVGARTKICDCGYSFEDGTTGNVKQEVKKVSNIFAGPGKGRKQCNECNRYIGARSLECPNCGADLSKKDCEVEEVKTVEPKQEVEERKESPYLSFVINAGFSGREPLIHTPAGECPFELKSLDQESVDQWCESIIDKGRSGRKVYLPSSMKYWLRFIHPIGTEEYSDVSEKIDLWAKELESGSKMLEVG